MRVRNTPAPTNDAVVLSGLIELAAGALTGWPYALAITDPDRVRKLGIRSTARLRQWHLDLIALGALTVLAGTAVPQLPRRVAWPLAIGAWTNANAFGVLGVQARRAPAARLPGGGRRVLRHGERELPRAGDPRCSPPAPLTGAECRQVGSGTAWSPARSRSTTRSTKAISRGSPVISSRR